MNIGLLQCDHVNEQFRHVAGDYPELFTALFQKNAPEVHLQVYDVCHGQLPQQPDECDGYVTTGSRYSAYDDEPWIHQLAEFIRTLHAHRTKLVGVCFGHQMIAQALGGSVKKSDRGWGIGVKPVQIGHTKPWMSPGLESYNLLLSHQDQVEELPEGGEVIGGNAHCPTSMFTIGDHFLGIQAHPEFTKEYSAALMAARVERIGRDIVEAAQETLAMHTDEDVIARWISSFLAERTNGGM